MSSPTAQSAAGHNPSSMAGMSVIMSAAFAAGIAHLGTSTMPFQIGALMDGAKLSASLAGTYGFFLVASLALTMILAAPMVHRFRPQGVAIIGSLVGAAAHALIFMIVPGFTILCALAVVAGIGYGMVFAAMVAAAAGYANADRLYSLATGGSLVFIFVVMAAFPYATTRLGAFGPFIVIAAMLALPAPVFLLMNAAPSAAQQHDQAQGRIGGGGYALLIAWSMFSLGTGALWSFAERIGADLKIDPAVISLILSGSLIFSIAGTGIAAWFGERINRIPSLLLGMTATGLSCLAIGLAPNVIVFGAGVLGYWIFYMFLYCVLLGTAAAMDPTGRVGTAGGGCERMGFAVGAPLGGLVVDHLGYGWLGILGGLCCVIAIPFTMSHIRRATQRS
jgi:hypothetical protein